MFMPRINNLILLAALTLLLPGVGQAQNRVLFIGNSFTIGSGGGGVPGIFDRLAQAGGQPDPDTVMQAVGGVDFKYHYQSAATLAAIASKPWTHVILQNYSTQPTHLNSGSVADHYNYGTLLYEKIRQNNPQTQVILFETWSRSAAHSMITGVSGGSSFASTAEFQIELRTNYQGLAQALNASHPGAPPVLVAPVGDAWEIAGGLRPASDPLFVRLHGTDEYHGNNNGYYLAACVFYSLIYGASPQGLGNNSLITSLGLGLTVPASQLEEVAWATVSRNHQEGVQSFLFDFGSDTLPTAYGPAPGDPFNHWNNIGSAVGGSATGEIANLVTTLNLPTDAGLVMVRPFNGANTSGTTTSAVFPANATRDSLFGNTESFNGLSDIFPCFKLTRLNPARAYSFTFFASRLSASDNRETGYTVSGQNSGYATLDAANNTDATALVPEIIPDADGAITISLAPTPNNNNANHFTYLGAMRMDAVPEQTPITFTRQPADQTVSEHLPVFFTAEVEGTPPFFIQWFSNGVALPQARQLTLAIPAATTNMDGSIFSVTVSNLAFHATSRDAVLRVIPAPPNPARHTWLFDFGGAATTGYGPAPDDPLNFWNNVTAAVGASNTGRLTNLITTVNAPSTLGLVMVRRFNGVNENGTTASPFLPVNATRDSFYGNTETFSGLANVFPGFKLVGLDPQAEYALTFYASRLGANDNRETGYTVVGANTGFAALNVANNVTNTARVTGIRPSGAGEIAINIAPTANNNNANHFTYLGVLRVDEFPLPPQFQPPRLERGQIKLDWTGDAQLEWASALSGPWYPITPRPSPPYAESVANQSRFFRLVAVP